MFQISDKVVCVDDSYREPEHGLRHVPDILYRLSLIKVGVVYVVREVWPSTTSGRPLVRLVGIPDSTTSDGRKTGYLADRFRKLSEVQAENAEKRANEALNKWNMAHLFNKQ